MSNRGCNSNLLVMTLPYDSISATAQRFRYSVSLPPSGALRNALSRAEVRAGYSVRTITLPSGSGSAGAAWRKVLVHFFIRGTDPRQQIVGIFLENNSERIHCPPPRNVDPSTHSVFFRSALGLAFVGPTDITGLVVAVASTKHIRMHRDPQLIFGGVRTTVSDCPSVIALQLQNRKSPILGERRAWQWANGNG